MEEDANEEDKEEEDAEWVDVPVASVSRSDINSGLERRVAPAASPSPLDNAVDPNWRHTHNRPARYDYYVARYEVIAAVGDVDAGLALRGMQLGVHAPPRTSLAQPTKWARSAVSAIPSQSTSNDSSSSSSQPPPAPSPATSPSHSLLSSPRHIARLESELQVKPHFIDAVDDLHILGEGSSGLVYSGQYGGVACVVKLPKSVSLTGAAWREWQCHLRLPPARSVVRFLGALPMSSTSYLVTALVRQGSLHSLLRSSTSCYCRPYGVMRCVRDMCAALRHMHSAGILHRDVSARNILVDSDGQYVLADLGLAIMLPQRVTRDANFAVQTERPAQPAVQQHPSSDSSQSAVPVRLTSPEALHTSVYSSASDVWSLGVALWEMTAGGALPYGDRHSSAKSCIRPIVAGQLTLHVDEAWGRQDSESGSSIGAAEAKLADTVRRVIQHVPDVRVQGQAGQRAVV